METKLWQQVENEIRTKFSFLQSEYGFSEFDIQWYRDEFNMTSRKERIEFSVFTFENTDRIPSISIINHAEKTEFDIRYNRTNQYEINEFEKENQRLKLTGETGKESVSDFILECAEILKRNSEVLNGNTSKLTKRIPFNHFEKEEKANPTNRTIQKRNLIQRIIEKIKKASS